jgi:hypothetical protein
MKKLLLLLLFAGTLLGCKKKEIIPTSGTETIDNILYGAGPYYSNGFSFSLAKKISSLSSPGPDILVYVNQDNVQPRLTFQANNLKPSFCKVGDYQNEPDAVTAFNNLLIIDVSNWLDMADPLKANQIWIYRTGRDQYAKIRIISILIELRSGIQYGECTFEWVYQPDGTTNFPPK